MAEQRRHYKTKPEDRIPLTEKIAYSAGAAPLGAGMQIVNQMSNVVLNMCLGLSPILIGLVMSAFRFWDALTDPVMGAVSDNTRSRWGRRRPYLVIGSVLSAIVFPLIWMFSREWSATAIFLYFMIMCMIYYTCDTVFGVPYFSLATEMTPDYHERTRLISLRAFANKLVAIGAGWLLSLVTLDYFKDELDGMRFVSFGVSIMFLTLGIIPAIFVKERYSKQASMQKKTPLLKSIGVTLKSKPFLMLLSMVLLMVVATQMVGSLGLYLNIFYVNGADKAAAGKFVGLGTTGAMILSIISIPFYNMLSARLGKTVALKINLWFFFVANALTWFLVNQNYPYLIVVNIILQGPAITGVWILLPSMQTDICDWDELQTGKRREGSYSSVFSWINKTGGSLSFLVANSILVAAGFNVKFGAEQIGNTFLIMRILYAALPITANIIILIILSRYPLTEQRCHDIRAELEVRRGKV